MFILGEKKVLVELPFKGLVYFIQFERYILTYFSMDEFPFTTLAEGEDSHIACGNCLVPLGGVPINIFSIVFWSPVFTCT